MKKIAIINNKFVIITKDIEFIEQNTNFYLPLIQEKIDKIIKDKRTMSCYLSKIIIQALEEVFDVDCIYNNSNSLLPEKDKLYISLKEYIKNNDTFKRKIKNNHPAIGFLNGEIAIRTKELEFEVQEKDIYLPLILIIYYIEYFIFIEFNLTNFIFFIMLIFLLILTFNFFKFFN